MHSGVGHGAWKVKKGGKSAKETKDSQTYEWNKVAPAAGPWGVLHHVNVVQSPPVK